MVWERASVSPFSKMASIDKVSKSKRAEWARTTRSVYGHALYVSCLFRTRAACCFLSRSTPHARAFSTDDALSVYNFFVETASSLRESKGKSTRKKTARTMRVGDAAQTVRAVEQEHKNKARPGVVQGRGRAKLCPKIIAPSLLAARCPVIFPHTVRTSFLVCPPPVLPCCLFVHRPARHLLFGVCFSPVRNIVIIDNQGCNVATGFFF